MLDNEQITGLQDLIGESLSQKSSDWLGAVQARTRAWERQSSMRQMGKTVLPTIDQLVERENRGHQNER
jgi:hypothetical protein